MASPNETLYERMGPIGSGMIRLLRLGGFRIISVPGDTSQHTAIECSLETAFLNDPKDQNDQYTALSYCWGDGIDIARGYIFCNGQAMAITNNLYDVLRELVDDHTVSQLWVDAICINQADSIEAHAQIALMGRIYRQATRVICWLGSANEQAYQAVGMFWDGLSRGLLPNDMDVSVVVAAAKFIRNCNWLKRSWTFQEAVLASSLRIQFGPYHVSWSKFVKAAPDLPALRYISRARRAQQDFSTPTTLYSLISRTKERRCTVAHDKIYSLLGLWNDERFEGFLYSNPAWSTREVFARAAIIVAHEVSHDIFLDLTAPKIEEGSPMHTRISCTTTHELPTECLFGTPWLIPNPEHETTWIPSWHRIPPEQIMPIRGDADDYIAYSAKSLPFDSLPFDSPFNDSRHIEWEHRLLDSVRVTYSGAILGQWTEPPPAANLPYTGLFREFPTCIAPDRVGDIVPRFSWKARRVDKKLRREQPPWKRPRIPQQLQTAQCQGYDPGRLLEVLDKHEKHECSCSPAHQNPVSVATGYTEVSGLNDARDIENLESTCSQSPGSSKWRIPTGDRRFWLCMLFGYDSLVVVRPRATSEHHLICDPIGRLRPFDHWQVSDDINSVMYRFFGEGKRLEGDMLDRWEARDSRPPKNTRAAPREDVALYLNYMPIQFALN